MLCHAWVVCQSLTLDLIPCSPSVTVAHLHCCREGFVSTSTTNSYQDLQLCHKNVLQNEHSNGNSVSMKSAVAVAKIQHHGMAEGGQGLWRAASPTSLFRAGPPWQVAELRPTDSQHTDLIFKCLEHNFSCFGHFLTLHHQSSPLVFLSVYCG